MFHPHRDSNGNENMSQTKVETGRPPLQTVPGRPCPVAAQGDPSKRNAKLNDVPLPKIQQLQQLPNTNEQTTSRLISWGL